MKWKPYSAGELIEENKKIQQKEEFPGPYGSSRKFEDEALELAVEHALEREEKERQEWVRKLRESSDKLEKARQELKEMMEKK